MVNKNIHQISFDQRGAALNIDITLETAQACTFEITSHDRNGLFQGTIMKGNNISGPFDSFLIPTNTEELDQRIIGWHIIIAEPTDMEKEAFSASISFRQDDKQLLNPPILISGHHTSEKVIIGFARFFGEDVFSSLRINEFAQAGI